MHHLGHTRSSYQTDHCLLTPDTFVRAPLPGMKDSTAIVHVSPAVGAAFTQYTVEFESGGALGPAYSQRFLYVLEGEILVEISVAPSTSLRRPGKSWQSPRKEHRLGKSSYAYFPAGPQHRVSAIGPARAAVIEKPYQPLDSIEPPVFLAGSELTIPGEPLMGDESLQVRTLLPADAAFDLAVNTMTFLPGASLPMVESHFMEHGLLMLEGGGIYRLGQHWYPVAAGDFIWMAPHCPQWFGAIGKTPARYLIL
jgi:(S)-ureidoglycine aminohydrolase